MTVSCFCQTFTIAKWSSVYTWYNALKVSLTKHKNLQKRVCILLYTIYLHAEKIIFLFDIGPEDPKFNPSETHLTGAWWPRHFMIAPQHGHCINITIMRVIQSFHPTSLMQWSQFQLTESKWTTPWVTRKVLQRRGCHGWNCSEVITARNFKLREKRRFVDCKLFNRRMVTIRVAVMVEWYVDFLQREEHWRLQEKGRKILNFFPLLSHISEWWEIKNRSHFLNTQLEVDKIQKQIWHMVSHSVWNRNHFHHKNHCQQNTHQGLKQRQLVSLCAREQKVLINKILFLQWTRVSLK